MRAFLCFSLELVLVLVAAGLVVLLLVVVFTLFVRLARGFIGFFVMHELVPGGLEEPFTFLGVV